MSRAAGPRVPECSCLPPWESSRDLLKQPAVAVGILEGSKGVVGRVLRISARRLRVARLAMEHLGHVHAAAGQLGTRLLDVVDDEVHPLGAAGLSTGQAVAELDGGRRAGRRELDDAG